MLAFDTSPVSIFFATDSPTKLRMPARSQIIETVNKLKKLSDSRTISVRFASVEESCIPSYLRSHLFVDAYLGINSSLCFRSFSEREFGSGTGLDIASASCHAVCEAAERLLPRLGGTKSARPTVQSAFSLFTGSWTEFDFDPLDRSDSRNPFIFGGGQAVHPIAEEALRNAFCDLVERNFVATATGNENWFDITESLVEQFDSCRETMNYWKSRGFDFHVSVSVTELGPFVVVASAKNRNPGGFPSTYRGSACDFCLEYAPLQAISELNRSGNFGPYQELKDECDALSARDKLHPKDYYYGFLSRLINGDWLTECSRKEDQASISRLTNLYQPTPNKVLRAILGRYGDIFVVPYCSAGDLAIFGYKICVPGLSLAAVERVNL